jgi:hypothetical protein
MGGHVSTNMFASRHAIMAVTESLGVQMPRAITALLVHIGPLGAALEAAFPFAAIALGAVLLLEHLAKLQAAGHELTEDQVKFGTAAANAFNTMDMKILQSGIRADELRNDHLGALHLQLQLIDKQSMAELAGEFQKLAHAADETFLHLKTSWYQFEQGSAGAKRSLDDFQDQYEHLLSIGDTKGAGDLLASKLARESEILKMQKAAAAQTKGDKSTGADFEAEVAKERAIVGLRKMGIEYGEKEVRSQERLVDILSDQEKMQGKVAEHSKLDKGNATASAGKEKSALEAEAAKQAAEHTQKMAEIAIASEREQARVSLDLRRGSIAERLAMDMHLADEEYNAQMDGNKKLIDALNKGGNDYANQLKSLQDKATEITAQHKNTLASLGGNAQEEQYRKDLQDLEQSERDKIESAQRGSSARLASIDGAIKEEQSKNLQDTSFYRDLLKQRNELAAQMAEEAAKLTSEAGKEEAENTLKLGQLALAADKQKQAMMDSARRVTIQQRLTEELVASEAEFNLKKAALVKEASDVDKMALDKDNKLKAIQNKELQLIREHENEVTAIKNSAEMERNQRILSAEQHFNDTVAAGLTQVLMGHKSFASMMNSLGDQVASGMIQNALKSMLADDMTKDRDAAAAARKAYLTGQSIGGPAGIILGPVMAAAAFAGVMAFNAGTDGVPGVGNGDVVPAMLTPGEGVVPGGVMDGLRKMAASGTMGGTTELHVHHSPTYHVQTIDGDGIRDTLTKHSDEFSRHVQGEIRKMNR